MFSSIPPETRIVIIDDIPANLRLLESSVKAFGLRHVTSFTDSAAGLEWLRSNPWDLLLLDLDMPAPDGFEILGHLGGRNRSRCPVIILTALNDPENRRRGLELGANDYLTKPVDLPELLLRMRNCLSLAHATASLEQLNRDLESKVQARTAQLEESYRSAIRALGRAACYRDNDTGDHIMRIGESAAMVAAKLGMPSAWCETIRLAAPMHDLGKIGISDGILLKQGTLTAEERSQMMEHPVIGYTILHEDPGTELSEMAAEIAYCHHEKWDGSGYPRGLVGEAIPLSARIVALCDVYDALRMDRPYKRAWESARAQAFIREQAGSHFDPRLVAAMESCFPAIEALLVEDDAYEERRHAT
ncbi:MULTISPECIES: HD domain-containing phosphohydrolase [unclassified Pseudomonas]|uniref:response regulator n=1 Tax=unclassified Pseudomonas TaxID=196821 RepID=UPI000DA90450|nr:MULTISPECIES: HD domain-containing phosphohydrolase [unclassified Pseudomonas]MDW3713975.1 response regulator [Pseudomonas sp. 2023EL-01195]PZE11935.1 two-component system response regulator [Pseudomonas sp. 57B-090624]